MKGIEHLTKNQIAGYRADALDAREKREIGRHLLKCEVCRKSLPAPTFDDFWKAVMNERETEQTSALEVSEHSRHSGFLTFPKIFGRLRGLALSSAALTIFFSIAFLLWLNAGREPDGEKEIARTFSINATESDSAQIESGEQISPPKNSTGDNQISPSDSNRSLITKSPQPNARQIGSNSSLRENASLNSARGTKKYAPGNISSTRGGGLLVDCDGETTIETETALSGQTVTLRWKKIPNAVKYHLYVSDEDEILIDEYETEQETSFALTKPLNPMKTYQWKVLITLENGNSVVGDSQKFTVKDTQQNLKKSEKNKKFVVRCTANN